MSELTAAMRVVTGRFPLVPYQVPYKDAKWFGKWTVNASTESVVANGGPWDTQQQCIDAVLATGQYKIRPNCTPVHLDHI